MSPASHQIRYSDIAVIVAAKNEEKNIGTCVASILKATEGKSEVIIVNDGSTDKTSEILKTFGDSIKVINEKGRGPSIARNKGIEQTYKKYVAFVDGDSEVDSQWLSKLTSEFNGIDKQFVSIGGAQQSHNNGNAWDLFHASFLECLGFVSDYVHSGKKTREVKHNPTCNVLYIKEAILEIGGFDPNLWPCEDLDLDMRLQKAGKKFLFTPDAIIFHHRPDSPDGFMKMMYRYGFGHAQIVKKHGISQPIHAMPILLVLIGLFVLWEETHVWLFRLGFTKYLIAYVFLVIRSKSLLRALIYGFYLVPSMMFWNIGFLAGLFQKMKITNK